MGNPDLNFKNSDPGSVQFGNFINYYQFHPPDNRLKLLPTNIWNSAVEPFAALDLGCNAGDLTISLYHFLKKERTECKILGVDIDPNLIKRAQESAVGLVKDVTFATVDFMNVSDRMFFHEFLKRHNLNIFSAVFCFSISMWIHLNHGDDGLREFLREISILGRLIVIEPQPWKCYRSAVRRMKKNNADFPLFKNLVIKQNVEVEIENFLVQSCGLHKVYESDPTEWGRKVMIFKHSDN